MTRLSHLTLRNLLIALHDCWRRRWRCLPPSICVSRAATVSGIACRCCCGSCLIFSPSASSCCYLFNLTTTKWRFISLPDALNILRVATVLTLALLVLDYVLVAPNVHGTFFFGKVTIILYWFLEISLLSALRFAYRYFRYTRVRHHARSEDASPTLLVGRTADAEVVLRGIESGAVKRIWPVGILSPSIADRGQLIRNVPVLGGIDDIEDVVRRFRPAQQADRARRDAAVGLRGGSASGNRS